MVFNAKPVLQYLDELNNSSDMLRASLSRSNIDVNFVT